MMQKKLKIAVIGLGLIGGSLAKGFKSLGHNLYCLDSNKDTLLAAIQSGIFDQSFERIEDLLEIDLDLIYLATPVDATKELLVYLAEIDCKIPITDASSTKASIEQLAADFDLNFCGGHPIAGKEKSGFYNSDPSMLQGAIHILTNQKAAHYNLLEDLHKSIGMNVIYMDPELHDSIFALISHFPHLTAFSLIELVQNSDPEAFNFTGGGFRDFTRIAGSDPTMWTAIFLDNKGNLINIIDRYAEILNNWKKILVQKDKKSIHNKIESISNIRRGL